MCVWVEVLVGFSLSLKFTHILSFLVPSGLGFSSSLTWTTVISPYWSPCLASFALLHPFLPTEYWVNFLQANQINPWSKILEQIPARGINSLFCSYVTAHSSGNDPCSFMSRSLPSMGYSYRPFQYLVIFKLSHVSEMPS